MYHLQSELYFQNETGILEKYAVKMGRDGTG